MSDKKDIQESFDIESELTTWSSLTTTGVSQVSNTNLNSLISSISNNNVNSLYTVSNTSNYYSSFMPSHQHTYYASAYTSNIITLPGNNGKNILEIHTDGRIVCNASPSKAADQFINALGVSLDAKASSKSALLRAYIRANDRILKLAKSMTKEELIAKLEEEQHNRNSAEVYSRLIEDITND